MRYLSISKNAKDSVNPAEIIKSIASSVEQCGTPAVFEFKQVSSRSLLSLNARD